MKLIDQIGLITLVYWLGFLGVGFLIFRRIGWNRSLLPRLLGTFLGLLTLMSLMTGSAVSRPVEELPRYTADNLLLAALAAIVGYVSGCLFVRRMK